MYNTKINPYGTALVSELWEVWSTPSDGWWVGCFDLRHINPFQVIKAKLRDFEKFSISNFFVYALFQCQKQFYFKQFSLAYNTPFMQFLPSQYWFSVDVVDYGKSLLQKYKHKCSMNAIAK